MSGGWGGLGDEGNRRGRPQVSGGEASTLSPGQQHLHSDKLKVLRPFSKCKLDSNRPFYSLTLCT